MKTPEVLEKVFHYANAHPDEETWRGVVLGPYASLFLEPGAEPPKLPTFGVHSLEELENILDEFRLFLSRWISLQGGYTLEAETLLKTLNDRARLRFKRWWLDAATGRLVDELNTDKSTFNELIYSLLGLALKEASFREIHRCEACEKFFYNRAPREVKFCSGACRNRTLVRRHRQRASERERESQHASTRRRGHKPKAKG